MRNSIFALDRWDSHDVSELFIVVLEFTFESDKDPDCASNSKHDHFDPENVSNVVVELETFGSVR